MTSERSSGGPTLVARAAANAAKFKPNNNLNDLQPIDEDDNDE